ncbi:apelin-like [Brienomyrus brachyistius]|uniref:apelin-like n=1 Tax=Brienomyrus brachyistius TaxID=42636 RepID=UPI0020B2FCD4|nr:apelin-like [Brienomyrus brachyistius]
MNVRILTLAVVLLVSLLVIAAAGPMATTDRAKELEKEGAVRKAGQQSPSRSSPSHKAGVWKRRRARPRLSHKGPMPF